MLIKLTDYFRGKKPGDIIDWPDGPAEILIAQKRAVKADKSGQTGPTVKAVDAPPVDKSMNSRVIAKKK